MSVTRVQLVGNVSTGASFAGIVTATSFTGNVTGNATGLSGTPNITVGNVTSGNINSSGVVTATTFNGALTGNATGLSGNPSITVTNATVNGVLSVGGTTVLLNAATLQINDKDITLGVTTDALGNNVANDTTANHGGISVASTVGTPIINIPIDGVNSDLPTNKQIMWVKKDHYTGLGTDAWIFNYGVSIGNTSTVQNGSRLTVGAGFTVYSSYVDTQDIRTTNINAGIVTGSSAIFNETRIITGAEKVHRQSGNTVTLTYNSTASSNVGYTTNPNGDITVNVVGIPTSSDFDDYSVTFAVIVNNTGTARTCTTVNLNGVSRTIRWIGGSLASAISGVTTTSGHTVFSFTGINTVGSASTAANYQILGTVSGGFW